MKKVAILTHILQLDLHLITQKTTTLQELLTFKLNFRVINDIGLIFQIDIHNQLP